MGDFMKNDEYYMNLALKEAKKAYIKGEIPIGAVVVKNGKIISRGYNLKESKKNNANKNSQDLWEVCSSVENSPEYLSVVSSVDKEALELVKDKVGKRGYINYFNAEKKRILKEKYNIDWIPIEELLGIYID